MLFGTDGIRGNANAMILSGTAQKLGKALASIKEGREIAVAFDSRISSPHIEAQLIDGIISAGGSVIRCGLIPTPALAYLTKKTGAAYGVMISASHNPPEDNGLKIFDGDGNKLPPADEYEIEGRVLAEDFANGLHRGRIFDHTAAKNDYIDYILRVADCDLTGLNVVLDCCFGATATVAEAVFMHLGARVSGLCNQPDGERINVYSGSTNPYYLLNRFDGNLGFAFDGDGDRVMAVDSRLQLLDGDHFLYHIANMMLSENRLNPPVVVGTQMTNLALVRALEQKGIETVLAKVGDKYVLEVMKQRGAVLGGEQSGHIIYKNDIMTGDGILAAALLAKAYLKGSDFKEYIPYPQRLTNIRADKNLLQHPKAQAEIESCRQMLGSLGRIFVRASGTEPVIRVLVEGKNREMVESISKKLTLAFEEGFGL